MPVKITSCCQIPATSINRSTAITAPKILPLILSAPLDNAKIIYCRQLYYGNSLDLTQSTKNMITTVRGIKLGHYVNN